MRRAAVVLFCACGAAAAPAPVASPLAPAAAPPDSWPARAGWATETIPFPLGFAPAIELRGVELLRFAPRFYDRASPGYFTYAFVWLVEPPSVAVDAAWLPTQLGRYFDGLCQVTADEAVAGCQAHPTRVELTAREAGVFPTASTSAWAVHLTTFDGFEANQPVTLAGSLEVWRCGARLAIGATLAPPGAPMVDALRDQARAFTCAPD